MAVVPMLIIGFLVISIIVIIILSYIKSQNNSKKRQLSVIYPFNAKIQTRDDSHPNGSKTVRLLNSLGEPQIQCPAGSKINIIGSWTDIVDPNATCSPKPISSFLLSCGFSSDTSAALPCATNDDCAPGMQCAPNQKCVPMQCTTNSDCGNSACSDSIGKSCSSVTFTPNDGLVCIDGIVHKDPEAGQCLYCDMGDGRTTTVNGTTYGHCAQSPTCANLNGSGQNKACTNPNYNCATRDSSAYLANMCDGKQVCDITWDPNNVQSSPFGPKPCTINVNWSDPNPTTGQFSNNYQKLPIEAGWYGGTPGTGENQGTSVESASYSQGYYVHGIYTCIPE